eukprot:2706718-Rhodomonas_salina.1
MMPTGMSAGSVAPGSTVAPLSTLPSSIIAPVGTARAHTLVSRVLPDTRSTVAQVSTVRGGVRVPDSTLSGTVLLCAV